MLLIVYLRTLLTAFHLKNCFDAEGTKRTGSNPMVTYYLSTESKAYVLESLTPCDEASQKFPVCWKEDIQEQSQTEFRTPIGCKEISWISSKTNCDHRPVSSNLRVPYWVENLGNNDKNINFLTGDVQQITVESKFFLNSEEISDFQLNTIKGISHYYDHEIVDGSIPPNTYNQSLNIYGCGNIENFEGGRTKHGFSDDSFKTVLTSIFGKNLNKKEEDIVECLGGSQVCKEITRLADEFENGVDKLFNLYKDRIEIIESSLNSSIPLNGSNVPTEKIHIIETKIEELSNSSMQKQMKIEELETNMNTMYKNLDEKIDIVISNLKEYVNGIMLEEREYILTISREMTTTFIDLREKIKTMNSSIEYLEIKIENQDKKFEDLDNWKKWIEQILETHERDIGEHNFKLSDHDKTLLNHHNLLFLYNDNFTNHDHTTHSPNITDKQEPEKLRMIEEKIQNSTNKEDEKFGDVEKILNIQSVSMIINGIGMFVIYLVFLFLICKSAFFGLGKVFICFIIMALVISTVSTIGFVSMSSYSFKYLGELKDKIL